MTEAYFLVLSGLGCLALGTLLVALLASRPHSPKPTYVEPYTGEFVPAETAGQQFEREKLSAWRAMLHEPGP